MGIADGAVIVVKLNLIAPGDGRLNNIVAR
jgi:hypothetical protein